MGRPAALSREMILAAATALVEEHGADGLSARRLGDALGCDPSSLYRHFANMDEVQREVGDRFLAAVHTTPKRNEVWSAAVRRICIELRSVQLQQPRLAALVRAAPTRLRNELQITEALLRELRSGGFSDDGAAAAYHSLIELTVGAAAIDATIAIEPAAERRRAYRAWQQSYAALDPGDFPNAVAVARHLYDGTADQRFEWALDALLEGLAARAAR